MLLRNEPFRDVDRLAARVFDTAGLVAARTPDVRTAGARLDAYRDGDVYVIDVDLPGVDPDTIDVTVDRTVLTVRAERRPAGRDGVVRLVTERPMGTFTRRLVLSETLDTDRLSAGYDAGVLTLRVPVAERAGPRRIEVTAATRPEAAAA